MKGLIEPSVLHIQCSIELAQFKNVSNKLQVLFIPLVVKPEEEFTGCSC